MVTEGNGVMSFPWPEEIMYQLVKGKTMAITSHCGDSSPHSPHTYYGPSPNKGDTKQVEYYCPGTSGRR